MITSSVYIATSLDGFIARTDGSIDWLLEANAAATPGEDFGYHAFMDSVDVLVMGRNTFDLVRTFNEWPYGEKRVVVLSSNAVEIPAERRGTVSASSEAPADLVQRLEAEGAKRLYIDGGITIQRFLAAGCISDITITLIPVLLGEGRPLFGPLPADVQLKHVSTKAFECGFVQVNYDVVRGA